MGHRPSKRCDSLDQTIPLPIYVLSPIYGSEDQQPGGVSVGAVHDISGQFALLWREIRAIEPGGLDPKYSDLAGDS